MAKIKVLDKTIANRISAGEVVEKPASVVKELIENSVDSGATIINVEIFEGGIKKIVVIDNGCGIESEDVKTAFLPHSTSKIQNIEDLDSICTLGFRGEALASISAVSQVELTTKTANSNMGTQIKIEGGEFKETANVVCNNGTKIVVNNLFYNTPARRKFLRKPKTEESEITHLIEKFLMSKPNIKIKYTIDGKLIYNTSGSGLYENIYTIYGNEVSNNLIEINFKNNKYAIKGYIGKPEISKPNRTYQTLMINGRIVVNFLISNAISQAYENFLMKGKFPVFVLDLILPFDNVDVNIHPSKQEVKFENSNAIFGLFNSVVNEALMTTNYIKDISDNNDLNFKPLLSIKKNNTTVSISQKPNTPIINTQHITENNDNGLQVIDENSGKSFSERIAESSSKNSFEFESNFSTLSQIFIEKTKKQELEQTNNNVNPNADNVTNTDALNQNDKEEGLFPAFEGKQEQSSFADNTETQNKNTFSSLKTQIIGTIFSTYIIVQVENNMYIIDQHACHERKIFDELKKQVENNKLVLQDLMVPYVFTCNSLEFNFFRENETAFEELGFYFDEFGTNALKVSVVPFLLTNINLEEFVNNIKADLTKFNKKTNELLKEYLAQKACKSAIKAGDNLSKNEIEKLIEDLENESVLLCPHGRPIIIRISKNQLEKWFKRIV